MNELRDMHSRANSLEGIKEKFQKAIIDNYEQRTETLISLRKSGLPLQESDFDAERRKFDNIQYENAFDDSLTSNDRWGIVSKKNFFGLKAEFFQPGKKHLLVLRPCSGRFQMQKFPDCEQMFPKAIDISDMHKREENKKFAELEEFNNMTNREVFEKYGVDVRGNTVMSLVANCLILDSVLKGRYDDLEDVYCSSEPCYTISIRLNDGTEICANASFEKMRTNIDNGVTIRKKDGKEATVSFDAMSIEKEPERLTDINNLKVENVVYNGDLELIEQLKQAIQEQFAQQHEPKFQSIEEDDAR